MRDASMIKLKSTFIKFYLNTNVDTLIEKWKKSVDNGGAFGDFLTDLSKAFDCISQELLIAKLHVYASDKRSLVLIYNHLSNCKQRLKVNDS